MVKLLTARMAEVALQSSMLSFDTMSTESMKPSNGAQGERLGRLQLRRGAAVTAPSRAAGGLLGVRARCVLRQSHLSRAVVPGRCAIQCREPGWRGHAISCTFIAQHVSRGPGRRPRCTVQWCALTATENTACVETPARTAAGSATECSSNGRTAIHTPMTFTHLATSLLRMHAAKQHTHRFRILDQGL